MDNSDTIIELLSLIQQYNLSVPRTLRSEDTEFLSKIYNGIGPENWHPYVRQFITDILDLFSPAALVHDYEFSIVKKSYKHFTQANIRLAYNCLRLALLGKVSIVRNTLHSRIKLMGLGLILAILCQVFGYKAYNNNSEGN